MSLTLRGVGICLKGQDLIAPFSLEVADGEVVTVMGPSGSGKSSLLAAIAGGLSAPFSVSGKISIDASDVSALPAHQRRIGRLFQDDLLFPHLTVGENLLFGMPRGDDKHRRAKMRDALATIDLEGFQDRAPHTLSGGQRQRVALMRSWLAEPHAMLLDEPFSKLDASLRASLRSSVFDLLKQRRTPTLLVTHDMSDVAQGGRVFKIENGKVIDV